MRDTHDSPILSSHLLALVSLAFCAPAAFSQATPGPKRTEPVEHPAVQRALALRHRGFQSFLAREGGTWHAAFDETTGRISLMYGSGIEVASSGFASIDAARAAAEATLLRFPELWGTELKNLKFASEAKAGGLYVFTWQQEFEGLEVRSARVQVQVHESGRVAALVAEGVAIPEGFSRLPRLAPEQAEARVKAGKTLKMSDSIDTKDFLVFVKGANGSATPVLAYRVDVAQPSLDLYEFVFVDANDGSILSVEPARYDFDVKGKVTGAVNTSLLGNTGPTAGIPIKNVRVTVAGVGQAVTDANGDYSIATGQTGPFAVSAQLVGPNYNVTPAQGAKLTVNTNTTSQGGFDVADLVFNTSLAEFDTAQTNGAYHHNVVKDYVSSKLPSFTGFANQAVNVNLASTCNAYFDPSANSINFYSSGGGCVNTAFSTVIYHEYGHGVDDFYGGIVNSSLSEAIGDIVAMYTTGQPEVGSGFFGAGTAIRSGENATVWPASNCNNEPHCVGETFMGFAWQAYKALKNSLGAAAGVQVAETDFLGLLPFNNSNITNAVAQVFLIDDNDGNVTNGTPHYADLAAAATSKGFTPPQVTILPIAITHTPYPDTYNQTQPYSIYASIVPTAPQAVTSATIEYDVNGVAMPSVAMAPTASPGVYLGKIPALTGAKLVSYRIRAIDTNNNNVVSPPGDDAYRFGVGRKTTLFFSDMEGGSGGWSHAQVQTQDDWNWGKPQTLGTNIYDPKTAYSGVNCWGNDLQNQAANQDGLYKDNVNNYLETPNINSTGHTGVRVRFRRWLTVESGQYDHANVLVNGTQVYTNPATGDLFDSSWTLQDYSGANANNNAAFRVRWQLQSDGGVHYGGWNLDDVEVYALEPTMPVSLNLSANPVVPIGTNLTINLGGTASAYYELFASLDPGPGTLDGFGVLDAGLGSLAYFTSGTLSAAGTDVFSFAIPYDPVLSGIVIYWVGGCIKSPSLPQISNTVTTTLQ
jgi:hypothetical protein